MSNLTNNTTQLEALLAKVNALPEAGGDSPTTSTIYTGIEIPTDDLGSDGDIYIVRSEV